MFWKPPAGWDPSSFPILVDHVAWESHYPGRGLGRPKWQPRRRGPPNFPPQHDSCHRVTTRRLEVADDAVIHLNDIIGFDLLELTATYARRLTLPDTDHHTVRVVIHVSGDRPADLGDLAVRGPGLLLTIACSPFSTVIELRGSSAGWHEA